MACLSVGVSPTGVDNLRGLSTVWAIDELGTASASAKRFLMVTERVRVNNYFDLGITQHLEALR